MARVLFVVNYPGRNSMTHRLAVGALFVALFYGCAGTGQQQQAVKLSSERIRIAISADSSTKTDFVILRPAGDTILGSSQDIALLFVQSDKTIAKVPMTVTSMGAPGRSETATTTITCRLKTSAVPKHDSMLLEVTNNGRIQRYGIDHDPLLHTIHTLHSQPIDGAPTDTSAVQLLTSYAQDGKEYTFTATALRRREVPGEYFPSSEQLRIRIINGKGAVVWSSNEGLAFLTMVYPVEPAAVGQMHEYSLTWNGLQSDGSPISAGRYTIEYTLPVKPLPYSTTVSGTFPLE